MSNSTVGVVILRVYALVLLVVGLLLAAGGAYLLKLGGSPYYVLAGLAVLAASILLFQRKAAGAFIYGLLLLVTLAWSLWESGFDGWALMPRIIAPAVLGLVLLIPAVRRALVRKGEAWSLTRCVAATVVALAVGVALREVVPPYIPIDPINQAGAATAQAPSPASVDPGNGDWLNYGNDAGGTRFSPLNQITPANVGKLEKAWDVRIGMMPQYPSDLEATPLKVDRSLYLCNSKNDIFALDAETGAVQWKFDAGVNNKRATRHCRGVAYYKAPEVTGHCAARIITNTIDMRLIAVDAHDGKRCEDFGTNGEVSLYDGMGKIEPMYISITSAPTLVHGKVVVGSTVADNQTMNEPSGVIRAYDAVTGKLAWAWDMGAPDRIGAPAEGEHYTFGTPNAWGPMSADETLGMVYVPLGNPTPDYYGKYRRPFDEMYGSALVALDADTGRPKWHFQTTHHDLWDYDLNHQPTLVDFPKANGEMVHAVIQPTKRGELFILDRVTGKPIFPVEERAVPQKGGAPDDILSPTQPYPTAIPSFRGADLTERSMWGITALDQLWCRIQFREARYEGPYTPPGPTPAVEFPGYSGGMEWGGVTVDPLRKILVVNTSYVPIYTQLIPREQADKLGYKPYTAENAEKGGYYQGVASAQIGTPYAVSTGIWMTRLEIPCNQPPYGKLHAMDLSSGKLLWSRRIGTGRDGGPWGIASHLPFLMGTPTVGGSVVTQTGLTFIASTQDHYLRAFDTATGKKLWEARLPAAGITTPMTYISPDSGRQFVVTTAAGGNTAGATFSDHVVAYALPKGTK
jgi:membrane-bound PQQ-dependent dehydrogenase (glucose/quinate/shikimate family)